jgi:hypothetical protein
MLKHRQVTVHITNLPLLRFYRDAMVDLGYSGWKNRQLQLWHASSYQPLVTAATIFRLILISSIPGKTPARSGDLTFLGLRRISTDSPEFPADDSDFRRFF